MSINHNDDIMNQHIDERYPIERACHHKKQWNTKKQAKASAKRTGQYKRAYLCPYCLYWHVGTKIRLVSAKQRAIEESERLHRLRLLREYPE